jgi:hypothetical protein
VKNPPKPERKASRREVGGDSKGPTKVFAVVLFTRAADSHETTLATFAIRSALRARGELGERGAAVSRRENARVFSPPGARFRGTALRPKSFGFEGIPPRRLQRNDSNFERPGTRAGSGFLLIDILRSDRAVGAIGIRRMRKNALGAGLGARTLTENGAESGSVYREKRLTVERAAA